MRMDTMHSPSCAKVSIASNDRLTARLDSLIKPMMLAARRLNLCASMPPGSMELGPQDVHDFMRLFHRIGPAIPWRIRFSIEPGGIEAHKFKRLAASIIGFMSESNRAVKRSFDAIETLAQEGECIVSM